jgi:orotate phosphoribosyltransferase
MLALIRETDAFFNSSPARVVIPFVEGTSHLFDLDRLWGSPRAFEEAVALVIDGIRLGHFEYSAIAGLTSRTGAFGTVPIASAIAHIQKLPLRVFDEEQFSEFTVHPHSAPEHVLLGGQRILLIKDVVLGGASLHRAYAAITKANATLGGVVALVDLNLYQKWHDFLPADIPLLAIARGPLFAELAQ